MNSSLKNVPQFDGSTSYCNKDFHLINKGSNSPRNLEHILNQLNKQGPMLGTKMFGRRKSRRKSRSFGSFPFQQGKLSTSTGNLGLPLGEKGPVSIYDTFPDIFRQGSALPRPYGPRDNLRMQSLFDIRGFGRRHRRSHKRKKSRKSRSRKSRKKFGSTPGTPEWQAEANSRNALSKYMNRYANEGQLKEAKGWSPASVQLYMNNKSNDSPNLIGMPNLPGQYTNNQLNSPIFKFGIRKKRHSKIRHKKSMCLKNPPKLTSNKKLYTKSCTKRKTHKKRHFGSSLEGGPNVVGYSQPIPLYHAGANTINFSNNKLFNPNIVGDIGSVQQDGMTPNAWLTQSRGIGDGLGNRYRFGSEVYTPDGVTYGTGNNVIMQSKPFYMDKNAVFGTYVKGKSYGKSRSRSKSLTTKFGGSVISLNQNGQIKISKS